MVNFRFHLISLTAVFLALALGIAMGVTVIDKATVDLLQQRLDGVRNEVSAANQRSDVLQRQVGRDADYHKSIEPYVVNKALNGVSVTIIGVRGTDQGSLDELEQMLIESGASLQGTLWFTEKNKLDDGRAVTVLARDLGTDDTDPSSVRQTLLTRVNAVIAGSFAPDALTQLISDGFLDWQGQKGVEEVGKANLVESRIVVASSSTAGVPNPQVAVPLVRLLGAQPQRRTVAVEPGREADNQHPAARAVFVGLLRGDSSLNGRISTVDHLETSAGRIATTLALRDIASGRTGNYGYGSATDGQIPKPKS